MDAVSVLPSDRRYEGESPDEVALVHAAAAHGCKLTARNSEYVTVALPGRFTGFSSIYVTLGKKKVADFS